MSSDEVEALATVPLQHIAQQHLVETPPSNLLAEFLGGEKGDFTINHNGG